MYDRLLLRVEGCSTIFVQEFIRGIIRKMHASYTLYALFSAIRFALLRRISAIYKDLRRKTQKNGVQVVHFFARARA